MATGKLFLLMESASGYSLFERTHGEEVSAQDPQAQASINDLSKFSSMVKMIAFRPFTSAEDALENIMDISEGVLNPFLQEFLEMNLPARTHKSAFTLGLYDSSNLGVAIYNELGVVCTSADNVQELLRGCRLHLESLTKDLKEKDLDKAQLGLGHSYSRAKVKFNVNRSDTMIIQAICLLDQLDKDINTFAMRMKEWYSLHFPELVRFVTDNYTYARVVRVIGDKSEFGLEKQEKIQEILMDEELTQQVLEASKSSIGSDISPIDLINIHTFADRMIALAQYRLRLNQYLSDKMDMVAPNLAQLIGTHVGARLVHRAGSLTSLAKYPASTVQILGAEKALFRALKTRGKTPKYGLIFHSSYIGRASAKNKGRISRYLANKCSIAARIDCFSESRSQIFGKKMKEQVEQRLRFYDTGEVPRKNLDIMHEALSELADIEDEKHIDEAKQPAAAAADSAEKPQKKKKSKKSKTTEAPLDTKTAEDAEVDAPPKKSKKKRARTESEDTTTTAEAPASPKKKKKSSKKAAAAPVAAEPAVAAAEPAKKKKKKSKASA